MDHRTSFEDLLRRKIGLDAATIGPSTMKRAIRRRMTSSGISDESAYLNLVRVSKDELDELVEEVIVPETWFFRNPDSFHLLGRHALSRKTGNTLRLLSVPCSTGEEPYSIAMTLINAGFAPGSFQIDGLDISKKTLQEADRAVYGRNSFRGRDVEFRKRFFQVVQEGFQLASLVRDRVRFVQDNILKSSYLPHQRPYDVIFCRNLFIYLEETARKRIIQLLERLLLEEGLLFVGPAETWRILGPRFISVPPLRAFAYKKSEFEG